VESAVVEESLAQKERKCRGGKSSFAISNRGLEKGSQVKGGKKTPANKILRKKRKGDLGRKGEYLRQKRKRKTTVRDEKKAAVEKSLPKVIVLEKKEKKNRRGSSTMRGQEEKASRAKTK